MKYLIIVAAVFAAACVEPKVVPDKTDAVVILPTVGAHATREPAEEPAKTSRPTVRLNVPTCKGIDTGDEKESLNLKLDCMLDGK
ncbi:hypothetical protein SAMN05216428_102380 [Nitrosospira sp. Nsp11]|uniref:hypothetical protein n=1 Tax=Nitrosospira sp. Nsp11 TaxID=1855338 RepID=UPI000911FED2|nr:hypothetical protein [Nitrosospira sp. Nsp11]SHL42960.1 hypothetical protein SAMN05216428_102380 [Nitrosospira sp. Nsp11]